MYAVQGASSPARVRCWLLMGGTLTIRHGCTASLVLLRRGTWMRVAGSGTLLGPEGTIDRSFATPAPWTTHSALVAGDWSSLEN